MGSPYISTYISKGPKQPRILHLGGRSAHDVVVVVLDNTEGIAVPFDFLLEPSLHHSPSSIRTGCKVMGVMLGDGSHFPHIKVG